MKVALVNHSDCRGGASVVTMRLAEALRVAGVDARVVVSRKETDTPWVDECTSGWRRKVSFAAEHAHIVATNALSRENMFKISTAVSSEPLHKHQVIKDADVVLLNWVNQGMASLNEIERIGAMGKPIVWTMHDMWCMTGVCHHAGVCNRYTERCGMCPLLRPSAQGRYDVSRRTFDRKERLYNSVPITFVAVSHWLRERAMQSALTSQSDVRVIPNAFPVDEYDITPTLSRAALGLPGDDTPIVVMGAARLDDPIKGLDDAVAVLNEVHAARPDVHAVLYGEIRRGDALSGLEMGYTATGTIRDSEVLRALMAHATVVLSTSQYETLPGTLVEGIAAGAAAVTYDRGGQSDIVTGPKMGTLIGYGDVSGAAQAIIEHIGRSDEMRRAGTYEALRRARHEAIRRQFDSHAVAQRYISLFNEILRDK